MMMRHPLRRAAVILLACTAAAIARAECASAQSDAKAKTKVKKSEAPGSNTPRPDTTRPPLFTSEAPLAVTFTTNVRELRGDRSDKSTYHSATMSYVGGDGKTVVVPMRAKTHGIWRLKHCDVPPIRLNIGNKEAKGTLFHDLQKPKLVNVCHDRGNYEQLVLQEMQLYRIYQLLTPASHRVRTLRVTYADSASGKTDATRYAFLFEDPDEVADRLGGLMTKTKGATAEDLDGPSAAIVYVFQYMIGNTDFSFNGLHNGELVTKSDGSSALPVAYDFDFSGAVNAPYATVDPRLAVKRVRDRLYRGYCVLQPDLPAAAALFRQKKDAIYALYHDEVGKLLEPGIVKETLGYFDDFYDAIKSDRDVEHTFGNCVQPR